MNPSTNGSAPSPDTPADTTPADVAERATRSCRQRTDPVDVREVGVIEYLAAWELQKELLAKRVDGGPDTLLLLEHPSVYTAGKRTLPDERPQDGTPVVDVDRGGKITWHGPGQLVGYPIVGLGTNRLDVVDFVRRLEQALIDVCDQFGVESGRVEGRSGVWLPATEDKPERKIGAIGLRVQQGVTEHGFAFNCDCDLSAYDTFVPCGIRDAGVTSLSVELGRDVTVAEVLPIARDAVLRALEGTLPVTDRNVVKAAPEAEGVRFELATG